MKCDNELRARVTRLGMFDDNEYCLIKKEEALHTLLEYKKYFTELYDLVIHDSYIVFGNDISFPFSYTEIGKGTLKHTFMLSENVQFSNWPKHVILRCGISYDNKESKIYSNQTSVNCIILIVSVDCIYHTLNQML